MRLIEIADDVFMLSVYPRSSLNVYLAGGVLIDAAVRGMGRRILDAIGGRALTAHALTHAHADHQGASAEICRATGVPFWCGEHDCDVAERGPRQTLPADANMMLRLVSAVWAGDGHPVARRLREGDSVGGFTVIETPGHSPGHVSFWRAADRVLICGDVVNTMSLRTTRVRLSEPPSVFTTDPALNRRSITRIADLAPRITCAGHGPPLRDTHALKQLAANSR
jgi:hydroxyacylglutathione hydrolase